MLNPKNYQLYPIGILSDFPINTIKAFQITKDSQILIINLKNIVYAIHGNCPYDNSKLSSELLIGDKVFCFNHGSAFCVKNGMLEYGPDLEDLRIYEIVQQKENLFVKIPNNLTPEQGKIINYKKVFGKPSFARVVFLGNDPGVISSIQTLRMSGFLGYIDLILSANNNEKPFDFTYAKNFKCKLLREADFFEKMKVNIITDRVLHIIPEQNRLEMMTPSGKIRNLIYDNLVLANGSKQIKSNEKNGNVFLMESLEDFTKIQQIDQKMIIIGSTSSAFNLASSLMEDNKKNEIILVSPFKKMIEIFGDKIAENIIKNLKSSGMQFIDNKNFKDIFSDGEIQHLSFQDGSKLEGHSIIVQKNQKPDLTLVQKLLKIDENQGLAIDVSLRTSTSNIFALGSLISYPLVDQGIKVRMPNNINESINQGVYVAFNILDNQMSYIMIPFESIKFGKFNYKFIGYYRNFDSFLIDGDLEKNEFITFYIKDDNIIGACSCGREKELMILYEGLRNDCLLLNEKIIDASFIIKKIKEELNKKGERNRCLKYETILKNLDRIQFK